MTPFSFHARQTIASLPEMAAFARDLAGVLRPGDVVALDGPLGAGKTTLVRLLGEALGLQEPVASPTFVLVHEYLSGPFPVLHADLYRLGSEKAESISDELFAVIDQGQSLVLVEWARYGTFLNTAVTVSVEISTRADDPDIREILLSANRSLALPVESPVSAPGAAALDKPIASVMDGPVLRELSGRGNDPDAPEEPERSGKSPQ